MKWIHNGKIGVEIKESFLNQNKLTFTHRNVFDLFIIYELDTKFEYGYSSR